MTRLDVRKAPQIVTVLLMLLTVAIHSTPSAPSQDAETTIASGTRYPRLIIRNAIIVDGNGTPASGPKDILIEGNRISRIISVDPVATQRGEARRLSGGAEIDAQGKYVLPGLINAHVHVQDQRGGMPQPLEYEFKLWLTCGITSVRDVGSNTQATLKLRQESLDGTLEAPRIFVYARFAYNPVPRTADEARARVRELHNLDVDGIKIFGLDRDIMAAMADEARKLGMRIAHHVGVEETTAWDDIEFGITSIEHWYGVPDAALPEGVQNFPADYNYNNETHRFRYAGRLWREADWDLLIKVLEGMVKANVAWVPTLDIYEASRDLQRAQTQPWFRDYLHPTLEEYFKPNPSFHGSYFIGWTSTDEAFWKENYRIWMKALREFERRGGLIGIGDDAGFIYQMYGFGMIREMELHQEAGFHPIEIIEHATGNNAKILGHEDSLGRIREGYLADLIVVNGNPLENMKVLYPTGIELIRDGQVVRSGGVEWTIKDGIPYHGPTLLAEIKEIVAKARAERKSQTSGVEP